MFNLWQFLAGLGIFIYGMWLLENSLKELVGRTFKIFLRKHTDNKLTAIFSGTVITAFLQSSSVVSFMVLAFVGAGIISMRNALAVILGSNLGTTLDSWVVAILGFKFNIEDFSFPIIAVASVLLMIPGENRKLRNFGLFGIGFGLLFLGIGYMKSSIEQLVKSFDLSSYSNYNRIVFICLGTVGTFLIQSSSAMVVIVLSALSQNAIPFNAAVGIIIGSELGTSFKLSLGSVKGIADKKRAALGNIIFNLVSVIFAAVFMDQLIWLVKRISGNDNPLIALVLFQTTLNFIGVLLFFPFLGRLADFLQKRYASHDNRPVLFLPESPKENSLGLDLLEKEALYFIYRAALLNLESFHVPSQTAEFNEKILEEISKKENHRASFSEKYAGLKAAESEILKFYLKLDRGQMREHELEKLGQLMASVRSAMYAAKGMKDVHEDFRELRRSSQEGKYLYHQRLQKYVGDFYRRLLKLLAEGKNGGRILQLQHLADEVRQEYPQKTEDGNKLTAEEKIEDKDIPTLLNVNREVYSSFQSMIESVKNYFLSGESAVVTQHKK